MSTIASRLLDWFDRHGRHDLPWQHPRSPYRVWVAEIMLQQTQVAAVIGYFERFMRAFPELPALAAADEDAVLAHWAGLGYYARARNLHRAARICMQRHGGELPGSRQALQALPGIGRSTAGAILAQAFGAREAILDGNVKRVLARHAGVEGWPGLPAVERRLWALAEAALPQARMADYTQALMDLGATLCRPRAPDCAGCPLAADCVARREGRVQQLPTARPRRVLPERQAVFLLLRDRAGRVLLGRRGAGGVWQGLWSLPQHADGAQALAAARALGATGLRRVARFDHGFSHYRLQAEVLAGDACAIREEVPGRPAVDWIAPNRLGALGLPAPIRRVLAELGLVAENPAVLSLPLRTPTDEEAVRTR